MESLELHTSFQLRLSAPEILRDSRGKCSASHSLRTLEVELSLDGDFQVMRLMKRCAKEVCNVDESCAGDSARAIVDREYLGNERR